MAALEALNEAVVDCRRCPRLVEWREQVAREKRAAYRDWTYWGRPMPGFGDPAARILVLGLAPAAHGGNRTGRIFTGDRSGDFLFAGLHRVGLANQAESIHNDDGLKLHGAYMVAAVRCAPPANLPTPEERANCSDWLEREVALLPRHPRRAVPRRVRVGERAAAARGLGGTGHRARSRSSATAWSPTASRGRCSAASTPASRTRSPASSRPTCSTRCSTQASDARLGRVRRYLEILRSPWVGALVASSLLSRLPIGINALAIVLYLREQTGSFAVAGAVSGALALGSAIGAPVQGRLVDRIGARRVLLPIAVVHAISLGAIVGLAELSAPTLVLLAVRLRRPASRSRRPRPCCARCGRTCSSRACTRRPTRWTAR